MKTLSNFMAEQEHVVESNEDTNGDIQRYLASSCLPICTNPAIYWKENSNEYPSLTPVAREYLSIQSSSTPVEMLFSIAGKLFIPERCRLKDKLFEQLMFVMTR